MSYEGYSQVICADGHYFERDCFDNSTCYCGAEDAWENGIDQTNGPNQGEILEEDINKFLIEPSKAETCKHCGHTKIIGEAIYRIPTKEETDKLRCWYDETSLDEAGNYKRIEK